MIVKRVLCPHAWLVAIALVLSGVSLGFAQNYPTKPIRLISPFPPGGVNDIVARLVAQKMSEALGQQVVVENRTGAGGSIGTDFVAKAAPDGYTLLSGGMGSLVMNPIIRKTPYDTLKDFAPVIMLGASPNVLVVHPSLPVRNVRDVIALAKARPGELNYASGGVGSTPHLSGALFTSMAGIKLVHVPYKGSALATTDLVAGHVQLAFLPIPTGFPHIENKKLKPLAVTGLRRVAALPNLPAISDSGLPGYEVSPWYGVLAPAGTPSQIIVKLNAEIAKIMRTPEMGERLASHGAESMTSTPEDYAAQIKADIVKWTKVVREARIKAE